MIEHKYYNNDNLKLVSINELLGMKFFIPGYQRGYRWKSQQVNDLLDDIWEFMQKAKGVDEIYCIQPLVVKMKEEDTLRKIQEEARSLDEVLTLLKGTWDVIDGQQRLTTIHILLSYLYPGLPNKYTISYATRNDERKTDSGETIKFGSKEYLESLQNTTFRDSAEFNTTKQANIDFYHMYNTYQTIEKWFDSKQGILSKDQFLNCLMENVQFIWYESDEADPIKVFTRLNIGKIALTDAELIKALFLNRSNFIEDDNQEVYLQQLELATEWDHIEYALQNDEFWLFIYNLGWSKPTRIEFIFDMLRTQNAFQQCSDNNPQDQHQTFRYFYQYFKSEKEKQTKEVNWVRTAWNKVKRYYQILEEWYNDLKCYHYVGFLVYHGHTVSDLIQLYNQLPSKTAFIDELIVKIKKEIAQAVDLDRTYGEYGEKKTACRPLLILYNIETVIKQHEEFTNDAKYKMGKFYKFPFHLYKKEGQKQNGKGWEVEHIASNAGDNLDSEKNRKVWLAAVSYSLPKGHLKDQITQYLVEGEEGVSFDSLLQGIQMDDSNNSPLADSDKQKIWNYALLDSATNEEYQNDPFPIKRICVLAKEKGQKVHFEYDAQGNVCLGEPQPANAFVPPCTKNVFVKAYTEMPTSLSAWTREDAEAYKKDIATVLKDFLN